MSREALKMALDYVERHAVIDGIPVRDAIKEALAQELFGNSEQLAQPTTGDYALGYAEGFNDACKPKAQREQEPVACDCRLQADECNGITATFHPFQVGASCSTSPCERVYTSPPQRQPLTTEQITKAFNEAMAKRPKNASNAETNRLFVRRIEAAHGIGDKT